ncbi:GBP2, partial [Symbiodinium sp. CCMP2456]
MPKSYSLAVNGKTLGCVAFVALLKQLVASVNDGRILSLHAAWESVQHTSCGSLSDELRGEASSLFQSLAAGRPIEGGAKLPLSEEALFTVVRDRKRALKAQWEERAFGDESVRRTYWKELKTSLAREENMVKTQNARVADQQLMEGVKAWQEWLDKDEDTGTDEICNLLGVLMTRMPGASLSRASRIAIQAAARRMSATRSAVAHALERQNDLQRKAVAWGEKAAQQ